MDGAGREGGGGMAWEGSRGGKLTSTLSCVLDKSAVAGAANEEQNSFPILGEINRAEAHACDVSGSGRLIEPDNNG